MSSAKLAVASGLAALALSACGTSAKPIAGSIPPTATTAGHAKVDDPRTFPNHVKCLRDQKLPVTLVGNTDLQIGTVGVGPTIHFDPTPGIAEGAQMNGFVKAAEIIGNAELYPNQASDNELKKVEDCLAQGVKG